MPPCWNCLFSKRNIRIRAAQCAEELTQINESLQRREGLLAASAKASRLLLEAPDVRAVIPRVLGLIGEAAPRRSRESDAYEGGAAWRAAARGGQ